MAQNAKHTGDGSGVGIDINDLLVVGGEDIVKHLSFPHILGIASFREGSIPHGVRLGKSSLDVPGRIAVLDKRSAAPTVLCHDGNGLAQQLLHGRHKWAICWQANSIKGKVGTVQASCQRRYIVALGCRLLLVGELRLPEGLSLGCVGLTLRRQVGIGPGSSTIAVLL